MGGTKVEAPQPTAAEQQLQTMQLDLLKKQSADNEALKPYIAQQMGFNYDSKTGAYTKMTEAERVAAMTPDEKSNYDLLQMYNQRQKDALEGKLPVSPALENDLNLQQKQIEESLSQRLGPNWRQTTGGIQALKAFNEQSGLLKEEARRGQMTTGEGLYASRMGLVNNLNQQGTQNLQGWGSQNYNLLNAYGQAYQPYQFDRNMQFQATQQTAANRMGLISGAMQAAGMAAGMYTGGKSPGGA